MNNIIRLFFKTTISNVYGEIQFSILKTGCSDFFHLLTHRQTQRIILENIVLVLSQMGLIFIR